VTETVTAVLVSHDGGRWLPAVLDGLAEQRRRVDRAVAVDTGSSDDSRVLLAERLGAEAVHDAPAASSYGAAVRAALDAAPAAGPEEWVWLLHDDSRPAPDALAALLRVARDQPSASILGPKLREWPSLRRLLEVGVTITGTGHRETGLERGEYDQGQHDSVRDVLAVNTAGMLVRRGLLDELGIDRRLPLFGNDVDLGWRAARAGHRTLVVPDAVVFHAEAAHRGLRRTALTGASPRRGERKAAIYTLLANRSAPGLPFLLVRLLLGSLLRALGLLLVRAPGEALDELLAPAAVYARPDRLLAARRARRRSARVSAGQVRHLLAPPWLPYRHGLDFVTDVGAAVAHQASDMSAARRARAVGAAETGPVAAEAQNLPPDTGWLARVAADPVAGVFAVLVIAALVAARGLVGAGMLSGGALLPAPGSATHWWSTYLESWHHIGVGSARPAAPYLLPLAVAGGLLLGKAWLLVDVLMLLAVPLAALAAYPLLTRVTGSRTASLWGAVTYGLLPVLSGAVQQGRLGTVVAAMVLPGLAHSALFLRSSSVDRRWRAAWRTALWLALLTAFVPVAWFLAAAVAAVALGAGAVTGRLRAGASWWAPVLVPLAATVLLLLPWSLEAWMHPVTGAAGAWFREAGAPTPTPGGTVDRLDLVLGRPGDAGAPGWLSAGIVVAALLALLRRDTRPRTLLAWVLVVLGLGLGAALSFAGGDGTWLGFPVLVAHGAAVCAAATAGAGIRARLSGASFGWRQPVGLLVVVVALLSPVAGLLWWTVAGSDGRLDRGPATDIPTYMGEAAAADRRHGLLLVEGARRTGFDYLLLRGPGTRLGDDTVLPDPAAERGLTELVSHLVTAPEPGDVERLSRYGVAFVYAPAPADTVLVGNLDSVSGVTPGSALRPGARAWQLEEEPTTSALAAHGAGARPWLLAAQALVLLTAAVLAAPSRRSRR
jgi:GT2 family glycosyltransferase